MAKSRMAGASVGIALGGKAAVHCVHDVMKDQITTERELFEFSLTLGIVFDPKQHKTHRCTCCRNLFVDVSDEPTYCTVCSGPLVHALGGPLPQPGGVVDG